MASDTPLASIVILVWNRADTLQRALMSVRYQTEGDLEVIVVDNGSDDPEAVRAIAEAALDERVVVIRAGANLGPGGGRNLSMAAARGDLIGFLDSDDELEPTWLEEMSGPFRDPACVGVTCGYRRIAPDGADLGTKAPEALGPAHHDVVAQFLAGTMLLRRTFLLSLGGYDERFWFGENTELGLRMAVAATERNAWFAVVPTPLLRWHDDGVERDYTERRLAAAELMLEAHRDDFARDRVMLARHLAVAGVQAARLGQFRRSRRHFWRLVRLEPAVRNVARLATSFAPPLARRRWGRA